MKPSANPSAIGVTGAQVFLALLVSALASFGFACVDLPKAEAALDARVKDKAREVSLELQALEEQCRNVVGVELSELTSAKIFTSGVQDRLAREASQRREARLTGEAEPRAQTAEAVAELLRFASAEAAPHQVNLKRLRRELRASIKERPNRPGETQSERTQAAKERLDELQAASEELSHLADLLDSLDVPKK